MCCELPGGIGKVARLHCLSLSYQHESIVFTYMGKM